MSTSANQMESFTDGHDSQEIVERWLDRLGFQHHRVESEMEDYPWILGFTNQAGERFQVGWMSKWDALQIQAVLGVEEVQQQAFLLMSAADRLVFLSDVSARVTSMALEDVIIPAETEGDPTPMDSAPAQVIMAATILVDKPLYCSDFFSHHQRVQGALRSVSYMFGNMALLRKWA